MKTENEIREILAELIQSKKEIVNWLDEPGIKDQTAVKQVMEDYFECNAMITILKTILNENN